MHHFHNTSHMSIFPFHRMRKRSGTIIIFVWFDVSLIFQIDTIFIAQEVPIRIIRIVRVTNMIDVSTLHQHNFFFHHLTGNGMSHSRVGFMTVHPFQFNGLSVHIIIASGKPELIFWRRCIFDFHFPKTYDSRNRFNSPVLFIFQFSNKRIAIRKLRRPLVRSLHLKNSLNLTNLIRNDLLYNRRWNAVYQRIFIRIQFIGIQRIIYFIILGCLFIQVTDISVDSQRTIRISSVQIGNSHQVTEMNLGNRVQSYRTEDTRQTEHILCLQKWTIRATIYFGCYDIFAFLKIRGNIEISGIARVLGEPHILTVNPKIEERIHTVETDEYFPAVPILRNLKISAEGTNLITVLISSPVSGRSTHHSSAPVVYLHAMLEDNRLIDINRSSILQASVFLNTIDIPARRYRDYVPRSHIIIRLIEICRTGIGVGCPMKLPVAIERLPELTVFGQYFASTFQVLKRKEISMRLLLIECQVFGRFPLRSCRSIQGSIGKPF